jgi:hypothetical protein
MKEETKVAERGSTHGPLPLIIGLAGQRDVREESKEEIRQRIREIFQELGTQYPHTDLVLFSSLGEGAPRLAAQVAKESGVRLIVPLPMEPAEYEKDFRDEASRREFRTLLENQPPAFVVPAQPYDSGAPGDPAELKERGYAETAACIARHSQILLVLWDGVTDGHTAMLGRWQLSGVPAPFAPEFALMDPVESGPVYCVRTPRSGEPPGKLTPVTREDRYPKDCPADKHRRILQRIDEFNLDWQRSAHKFQQWKEENKRKVCPPDLQAALSQDQAEALEWYGIADSLALRFQRRTLWTLRVLFMAVLLSVIAFEVYAHMAPHAPSLLALYPGLVAAAVVLYRIARRGDWENKYLDYRALAEGLRVQFFWRLARIDDCAADHYLRTQRTEMDWIRIAIMSLSVASRPWRGGRRVNERGNIESVQKLWIDEQLAFFTGRSVWNAVRHLRTGRWAEVLVMASPAVAVLLTVRQTLAHAAPGFVHAVTVAIAVLLVLGALLEGYAHKRAYAAHAKRYEWMKNLFQRAQLRLSEILGRPGRTPESDDAEAVKLIKELGKEALVENGNWLLLRRDRPLDLPKP